ncbi:MAG: hypothetical protein ACR2MP_11095 [Streptosporangiaceae bacterium]
MSDSPGLEQGYRRLLASYPGAFRRDHADEILGVLMASAGEGQRRPRLAEAADLLWSGLKMRLRGLAPAGESRPWTDALALLSLVAPLFLLLVDVLVVALPYRLWPVARFRFFMRASGSHPEIGGLRLLGRPIFDVTVGLGVIVAILVLLGLRWMALGVMAASVVYWVAARQTIPWVPYPLQLLTTGGYLLETAALIASPGPRRGRQLVNWRYAVVLLVGAAAIQLSTFMYDATSRPLFLVVNPSSRVTVYLVSSVVLAVAAVILAVAWKLSRYFLLLLAVMCYPYAMQLAFTPSSSGSDLLGSPTPVHLTALFLPPVLFACGTVLAAVTPRRSRLLPS